jgi:hypothetical protein
MLSHLQPARGRSLVVATHQRLKSVNTGTLRALRKTSGAVMALNMVWPVEMQTSKELSAFSLRIHGFRNLCRCRPAA